MRFLKFYRPLSNDTYYLKFNFKNVSDSGSILTTISAHNHQLAYQNNSSNHRETCSVCGYDEVVSHTYTNSYARCNSAQHTAYCTCGASRVENHSYTARYQNTDSSTHTAYCACGASKTENHSYSKRYIWIDGYSHNAFCGCGAATVSGHYIKSGSKPPHKCMYCKGIAEAGFSEYRITIPIGATQITKNGSYVLPNGITIVAEADLEDFLNGTPKLLKHNLVLSA